MSLPFEDEARAALGPDLFRYLLGRPRDLDADSTDANEAAFARYALLPRVMTGARHVATATRVLGTEVAAPLAIGAYAADTLFSEGGLEPVAALCQRLRLPLLVSEETVTPLARLAGAHDLCWLQLRAAGPVARVRDLAARAASAGVQAVVLTVLAPVHPRPGLYPGGFDIGHELQAQGLPTIGAEAPGVAVLPAFPQWSWNDVASVAEACAASGVKLLAKGILHPADVALAERAGCAGVIVSNIGLRQLGRWPASLDQVPAVRAAAAPETLVAYDGGVRGGADILAACLLGAGLAVATRPVIAALAAGGAPLLETMLREWLNQLAAAIAWMGAESIAGLAPDQIVRRT